MNRRQFLSTAAGGLAATGAVPTGFPNVRRCARRKNLVHLFMKGGMSHLDTFDPKPDPASGESSVPTMETNVSGIRISGHLPLIAERMDRITLIRSMSHSSLDHARAQSDFLTGLKSVPGHSIPTETRREGVLENHQRFLLEMTKVPDRLLDGHDLLRMELDGWDTHTSEGGQIARQSAILDRAFSRLIDDLEEHGLLEDTLVVVATEFGRSAMLNSYGGRNHHAAAFSCLIAGGGTRGGKTIGGTNCDGMHVVGEKIGTAGFYSLIAHLLENGSERRGSKNILSV